MKIDFDIWMTDENVKNILKEHFEETTGMKISGLERYCDGFRISVSQETSEPTSVTQPMYRESGPSWYTHSDL